MDCTVVPSMYAYDTNLIPIFIHLVDFFDVDADAGKYAKQGLIQGFAKPCTLVTLNCISC